MDNPVAAALLEMMRRNHKNNHGWCKFDVMLVQI